MTTITKARYEISDLAVSAMDRLTPAKRALSPSSVSRTVHDRTRSPTASVASPA